MKASRSNVSLFKHFSLVLVVRTGDITAEHAPHGACQQLSELTVLHACLMPSNSCWHICACCVYTSLCRVLAQGRAKPAPGALKSKIWFFHLAGWWINTVVCQQSASGMRSLKKGVDFKVSGCSAERDPGFWWLMGRKWSADPTPKWEEIHFVMMSL